MKTRLIIVFALLFTAGTFLGFSCNKSQQRHDGSVKSHQSYDGIDVSHHNGKLDWKQIAKDTAVQFVYIKATDGATWQDNRYEFNLTNARKQGIKVGSYHYFRMTSAPQAQFANLKKMMKKGDQDLIPMIDVELYKNKKGFHMDKYYTNNKAQKAEIVANLRTLLTLVEKEYGCKPMIYCTPASYNHILKGNFKGYKLYVGRYGGSGPGVPGWTIWQYSEKGRIVGMHKNCDVARFAKDSGIEDITMPQPRQKKAKNAPKN